MEIIVVENDEKIPKIHLQPQGNIREIKLKYNGATACVYIRDNQLINISRRVVHTQNLCRVFVFMNIIIAYIYFVS